MKKSLVALAVLGAFAGVAQAQSSVSLYGIADVWVGSTRDGAPGTNSISEMGSGGLSTSRIGFKGTEDLGGGLSAVFGLEAGLNVDVGQSSAGGALQFNRQSFVGLAGGFGEVIAGRVWTAYDDIEAAAHQLFGASDFAVEYAVMDSGNNYSANPSNGFKYSSPEFGGFKGAVSYSLDEKTGAANVAKVGAFNVTYTAGPLYAGLAYQQEKASLQPNSTAYTRANATYDFGVAQLLLTFGRVKEVAGAANEYSIGVNFPVSPALTLSAAYAIHNPNSTYSTNPDGERKGFGVGATYALSKRTTAYAAYTTANTDDAAGVRTNEKRLLGVGVRHAF